MAEYQVWNNYSVQPKTGFVQGQGCNAVSGAAITLLKGLVSGTLVVKTGDTPIKSAGGKVRVAVATCSASLPPASLTEATQRLPIIAERWFDIPSNQNSGQKYVMEIPHFVATGFKAYVWFDYSGFDANEAGNFTLDCYLTEINI